MSLLELLIAAKKIRLGVSIDSNDIQSLDLLAKAGTVPIGSEKLGKEEESDY